MAARASGDVRLVRRERSTDRSRQSQTGAISHPAEGEVVLNDAYRELAAHYCAAVLPGRVRKPKDKASVENTVSGVATWVIAALRDEQFATLPELREAIYERMDAYNAAPFQSAQGRGCRCSRRKRSRARGRCRRSRMRSVAGSTAGGSVRTGMWCSRRGFTRSLTRTSGGLSICASPKGVGGVRRRCAVDESSPRWWGSRASTTRTTVTFRTVRGIASGMPNASGSGRPGSGVEHHDDREPDLRVRAR